MNNTESKEPLYRQLNKERTQGEWVEQYDNDEFGQFYSIFGWGEGNNVFRYNYGTVNEAEYKANAQYATLAVNHLSSLAEALETLIDRLDTNWDAITAGGQKGILTALTKEAKEALLKIS